MSLMRAFTTKLRKTDASPHADDVLGRAASQRTGKPILRSQISSPLALVSTTNPLSYNAPNIAGTKRIQTRNVSTSSSDTFSTSEDSDTSTLSINTNDTGSTATDASSIEHSPITPEPELNHLSCYFKPAVDTRSPGSSPDMAQTPTFDATFAAPAIPKRVPSHSKKAHETLHRKKSLQRRFSPNMHVRSSTEIFTPLASPSEDVLRENYFGNELAQLNELAEDFGVLIRDHDCEGDMAALKNKNLASLGVSDYLNEIESLVQQMLHSEAPRWI